MSLLGQAALAMWWDMAPAARSEFEDWHAHEHFPERMGIAGFMRGTRWASATGGDGVFVMYELQSWDTLSSAQYLARLNSPSAWSTRMMPHHRSMVRSQCRVLESRGGGVARHALTLRLSPQPGQEDALRAALRSLIDSLVMRPGVVGGHLLRNETPAIAQTTEQVIRGLSDQAADWVLVMVGYDIAVLEQLAQTELGAQAEATQGAKPGPVQALYTLAYSATPGDLA
ncbi:hypothetical protein [Caenimonas sp. SL110]|uniref:hypothetical protein n=1 Tax=Caenimonas sp. SL110 TaxID=1450524 RepID=UPI00065338C6|nr:hypothetical protein [Caenimonas sp. SL110]